jgi:hypothetical protein
MRPVTTHNRHLSDFASWRGLFVIAGVAADATNSAHVVRSDDGQAALWLGGVDDLWRLGAPAGVGGPWKETAVTANTPSDPYLMFGYERKVLELAHTNATPVTFVVEVDFAADNSWGEYTRFTIVPGQTFQHVFPDSYSAHWVRLRSDTATRATAQFSYGPAAPQITGAAMLPGRSILLTFTGGARAALQRLGQQRGSLAPGELVATGDRHLHPCRRQFPRLVNHQPAPTVLQDFGSMNACHSAPWLGLHARARSALAGAATSLGKPRKSKRVRRKRLNPHADSLTQLAEVPCRTASRAGL